MQACAEEARGQLPQMAKGVIVRKLPLLWQIPHSHLVDSGA